MSFDTTAVASALKDVYGRRLANLFNADSTLYSMLNKDLFHEPDPLVAAVDNIRRAHGLLTSQTPIAPVDPVTGTIEFSLKEFSGKFDISWKMLKGSRYPNPPSKGRKYRKFANYER